MNPCVRLCWVCKDGMQASVDRDNDANAKQEIWAGRSFQIFGHRQSRHSEDLTLFLLSQCPCHCDLSVDPKNSYFKVRWPAAGHLVHRRQTCWTIRMVAIDGSTSIDSSQNHNDWRPEIQPVCGAKGSNSGAWANAPRGHLIITPQRPDRCTHQIQAVCAIARFNLARERHDARLLTLRRFNYSSTSGP